MLNIVTDFIRAISNRNRRFPVDLASELCGAVKMIRATEVAEAASSHLEGSELQVIVAVSNATIEDEQYDIWDSVMPQLAKAIAKRAERAPLDWDSLHVETYVEGTISDPASGDIVMDLAKENLTGIKVSIKVAA
jgi:hypothetical protein